MRCVVEEMGVIYILNGYGQTEASSCIVQTRPYDPLEIHVATVGWAIDGVEIKVINPANGQPLGSGQVGEICAWGFNMLGYYQMPAATNTALNLLGWLHTGDLGSQDQGGPAHLRPAQGGDPPGQADHLSRHRGGGAFHPPGHQQRLSLRRGSR
ncbi:hypothetical protein DFAR_2530002 [Desulfarculales bacterium]